jgi:7-carboxy-7-deazaguanine synthase
MTKESIYQSKYPIAEQFTSPQGEGVHNGVLMNFVRLAGCSVGKPWTSEQLIQLGARHKPAEGHECCTLYDGRQFICDTDYGVKARKSVHEIIDTLNYDVRNICLTGGEPLIHNIQNLLYGFFEHGFNVYVETSGTKEFQYLGEDMPVMHPEDHRGPGAESGRLWYTVAPKLGVLPHNVYKADEIKVLVDEHFNETLFLTMLNGRRENVFIQPVNHLFAINFDNLDRCLALQLTYPWLKISTQTHKTMQVR